MSKKTSIVTGAFSYTGRYITKLLQEKGETVRNFTNHPSRPIPKNSIDKSSIDTYPLVYDDVTQLSKQMEGADTLYCTYWVRFNDYKDQTREIAVQRAQNIIQAAKNAGISKIIYTSHTYPTRDTNIEYVKGKIAMEDFIKESGISYGFAKPCMIFGETPNESIVINNLAYVLKRSPLFLIPGHGLHPVQPVHVQDLAELCVEMAQNNKENFEKDAVGPEIFTFENFVKKIQTSINSKNLFIKGFNNDIIYKCVQPLDYILKDKFIEKEDLDLITSNYLCSQLPATGKRNLSDWVEANKQELGQRYISSTALYYEPDTSIFDKIKVSKQ